VRAVLKPARRLTQATGPRDRLERRVVLTRHRHHPADHLDVRVQEDAPPPIRVVDHRAERDLNPPDPHPLQPGGEIVGMSGPQAPRADGNTGFCHAAGSPRLHLEDRATSA
jgi:hypothetical protein